MTRNSRKHPRSVSGYIITWSSILIAFTCLYLIVKTLLPSPGLNLKVFKTEFGTGDPDHVCIDTAYERTLRARINRQKVYSRSPSFVWSGYMYIPHNGDYFFSTLSVNHSKIFLNDYLLVDNGLVHPVRAVKEQTFLNRGWYRLKIEYFPETKDNEFVFRITGDGFGTNNAIPYNYLFPVKIDQDRLKWIKVLSSAGTVLKWGWITTGSGALVLLFLWIMGKLRFIATKFIRECRTDKHKKNVGTVMMVIIIVGFGIRLCGLTWGLPYRAFHVDETVLTGTSYEMMVEDKLNPGRFDWPSLPFYILLAQHKLVYLIGHDITGTFRDLFDFELLASLNYSLFKLLGRTVFALLSALSIPVLFMIGKHLYDEYTGMIAALFLALDFLHVKLSHFIIPDGILILLILLSVYFAVRLLKQNTLKYYILAGLFAGFAAASKYNGGMIVAALLIVHLRAVHHHGEKFISGKLTGMGIAAMIGFLAGCPYAILDFANFFVDGLLFQFRHFTAGKGHGGVIIQSPWYFYIVELLPHTCGRVLMAIIAAGLVWGLFKRPGTTITMIAFPIVYGFFLFRSKILADRYIAPILPFLYLMGAAFLYSAFKWLCSRKQLRNKQIKTAIIIAAIVFICFNSIPIVKIVAELHFGLDTRIDAKNWIESNIDSLEPLLFPYERFFGPPLNELGAQEKNEAYLSVANTGSNIYLWMAQYSRYRSKDDMLAEHNEYGIIPWNHVVNLHSPIISLQSSNYHYIIISSYRYDRYFKTGSYVTGYTRIGGLYKRFYEKLDEQFPVEKVFEPSPRIAEVSYRWPLSPVIKIYRIPRLFWQKNAAHKSSENAH